MNDSAQLLRELRIDRSETHAPARPVWLWVAAALGLLVLAVLGYWFVSGAAATEVRTAPARAIAGGAAGPASVLDASGYVTARRQATVSS
jgi:hypothetical protein